MLNSTNALFKQANKVAYIGKQLEAVDGLDEIATVDDLRAIGGILQDISTQLFQIHHDLSTTPLNIPADSITENQVAAVSANSGEKDRPTLDTGNELAMNERKLEMDRRYIQWIEATRSQGKRPLNPEYRTREYLTGLQYTDPLRLEWLLSEFGNEVEKLLAHSEVKP
jgi:cob(I)alamin adenosyltransferase